MRITPAIFGLVSQFWVGEANAEKKTSATGGLERADKWWLEKPAPAPDTKPPTVSPLVQPSPVKTSPPMQPEPPKPSTTSPPPDPAAPSVPAQDCVYIDIDRHHSRWLCWPPARNLPKQP